jgi:hypothetical protein
MLQITITTMAALQFLKITGCMLGTSPEYESMQA